MAKIFIDAGHGGHDPGALGSKSNEKSNVLKVALKLKTLLEKSGHTVKLSRSTDVYLTLNERARLANAWGADYFVSLHNNSAKSNAATGFETFVHDGPLQSKTLDFQKVVHNEIAKNIGIPDRGKKRANYAVLRLTKMPALLIEYEFINNPNGEALLINQVDNLALWTAQGINKMAGGKLPAQTSPVKGDEEQLNLSKSEREEMALIFKHARDKGIFSSAEHENSIVNGTMTLSRLQYLQTIIAGAGINEGKRIK